MRLNPLLIGTDVPPIPEAKAWTSGYDGSRGPLIDLSQAVPGYPPHPEMLARLGRAAAGWDTSAYGDITGDPDFRDAYAQHVARLYRSRIARDEIAITAGCNQAFTVAMIALAGAGDRVIVPSPWYFNHRMALDMLGMDCVALPCRAEAGFVPDPREARALVDARTRAIVLVTPNNPTGAIYPPETIRAFQELCAAAGIALVLDETYRDFLPAGDEAPHGGFADPDWPQTLIQLYSFSKSYCIPGHRIGAIVAGQAVITEVAKVLDSVQICAPRTAQSVLPWAIEALEPWREANRQEILTRAEAFSAAAAQLDGWTLRSVGAYFAYLEHAKAGSTGKTVAERLARERGVLMLPGSYFGPGQDNFLRVAFANVDAGALRSLPGRLRAI